MRRRTWLYCAVIALCPVIAFVAWRVSARADKPAAREAPEARPAGKKLPLTQVVLFNTGLGYFQREGEVEGDARIDLSVPTADVNDLLKSLVIDNAGKPFSVSYEGVEPIDHKLSTFTLDLTSNPSLDDLLLQARGEKVELTIESGNATTPLNGSIVGVEAAFNDKAQPANRLIVLCSDGVRRVPLDRVQRVRFLDPVLEEEFKRALAVLSAGRAEQRRVVSVHLKGEGKRNVKIGYVAETPIWKATYRLRLTKGEKPTLLGFGIVENTTDEDWKDVRVILVSGRPITFKMDLAQQLFMPRPTVEPEIYASLRPPTFGPEERAVRGGLNVGGQLGQGQRGQPGQPGQSAQMGQPAGALGGGLSVLGGGLSVLGGGLGGAANLGFGGGVIGQLGGMPQKGPSRLTYEEYQERRQEALEKRRAEAERAKELGSNLASLGAAIDDFVVNADRIGEGFEYTLEPKVTLPRQRSALLPLPAGEVGVTRLSIYAPTVHPRFPMQTVKLKNGAGQHLMQGPVSVYDDGRYVGDCRLPDMQPNQERLLSFAIDLGVEVRPEQAKTTEELTSMTLERGVITTGSRNTRRTTYQLHNRSAADRTVLVEHAISNLTLDREGEKPAEKTRSHYRFEWKVPAGRTLERTVIESADESARTVKHDLATLSESAMRDLAASPKATTAIKQAIDKVRAENRRVAALAKEKDGAAEELAESSKELEHVMERITKLPAGSDSQKRYLAEFEKIDPEVKKLKKALKEKNAALAKAREEREEMIRGLSGK
jgi:hypothetical protein